MAKIRGSFKKVTKSTGEQASSATTVHELESLRLVQTNEPVLYLNKAANERFHDNILKRNFYEQGISFLPQQDLGKQVSKSISKFKWENFCTHPRSYSPSLVCEFYANLYDHELELKPSTHSNTGTLDRMCLINSIVKGRKIDVGAILHQEIADCAVRQTEILVFLSLVMLLCQQREIVPRASEEVLENKGPIVKPL
ncbi:hypothetical protein PVK06_047243 [Gossypium arboreum]|uniref:Uncharacterized protein n=1 Tax=Gossypium arboreum TaxID=29729 RepID=A0ABR0MCX2_GOSAR|nr:hypothetical protein PVK06_047243 [Gossypium arboreum]